MFPTILQRTDTVWVPRQRSTPNGALKLLCCHVTQNFSANPRGLETNALLNWKHSNHHADCRKGVHSACTRIPDTSRKHTNRLEQP
jgi:hypothetical protein